MICGRISCINLSEYKHLTSFIFNDLLHIELVSRLFKEIQVLSMNPILISKLVAMLTAIQAHAGQFTLSGPSMYINASTSTKCITYNSSLSFVQVKPNIVQYLREDA